MGVEIVDGVRAVVTREFAAPPERLYRAFTDPVDAAAWMWGRDAPNAAAEMDLRVGGRYSVAKDAPADDDSGWGTDRWAIRGTFIELDPPRRLVYTLHWSGPVGYNQTGDEVLDEAAVVTFEATEAGTRVVYDHIGIPDDGMSATEHGKGLAASFESLALLVEQG